MSFASHPKAKQGPKPGSALPSLDLCRLQIVVSKASLNLADLIGEASTHNEAIYLTISTDFPPQQRLESYAPGSKVVMSPDLNSRKPKMRHSSERSPLDLVSKATRGHEKKASTASSALSQNSSVSSTDEAFGESSQSQLFQWRLQTFEM